MSLLRAAGTVTKKLAQRMAANGYLDAAAADEAVERGTSAARDLPRAERLSRLLFDQAQRGAKDCGDVADDDIVEDYFTGTGGRRHQYAHLVLPKIRTARRSAERSATRSLAGVPTPTEPPDERRGLSSCVGGIGSGPRCAQLRHERCAK